MFFIDEKKTANTSSDDTAELRKATIYAAIWFFATVVFAWLWAYLTIGENLFGYYLGWETIIAGYPGVYVALRKKKFWKSLLMGTLITVVICIVFDLVFNVLDILKYRDYRLLWAAFILTIKTIPSNIEMGFWYSLIGFFSWYFNRSEYEIIETSETEEDESSE